MSTSDQQEHGPLTRKQLREIRLTGATPVITPEEAAAAAAAAAAPPQSPAPETEPVVDEPDADASAVEPEPQSESEPEPEPEPESTVEEPAEEAPTAAAPAADVAGQWAHTPLTRRQVRERERGNTAPTAVPPVTPNSSDDGSESAQDERAEGDAPAETPAPASADEIVIEPEVVTAVPADDIDDADADEDVAATPVSASATVESAGEVPLVLEQVDPEGEERGAPVQDLLADGGESVDADDPDSAERPTVSSAFGRGVLKDAEAAPQPFTPSFDELLTAGDSAGSQHLAPNTLIFNPSPGDGSLSGPVASTGEILVTGSYELPKGLGSQGHAHGTTDGKDIDSVLIDGELPPASSPTPIAASAAVSTIKPAGEVIRPPAPEKGNKLMLILAIVAGGLALALGVALIVAFTTNVF
ncbi:hypothetical protein [Microbacterium sp. 3J1]|uniref:hypothetical protein n=1 Tax=Microbacterium sp. 3J1 TaxID=861269 RepID=UPI000A8EFA1C|nr:hypothetical protein [Microbacterium sp. 3J1]